MKLVHAVSVLAATFGFSAGAAAAVPTWCSGTGSERVDSGQDVSRAQGDDPRDALKEIVGNLCKPDSMTQQNMAAYVAAQEKWTKKLDLTDADWVDVAQYATLGQGPRMNGEVRINTQGREMGIGDTLKRAWSSYDNIDQYVMIGSDVGASNSFELDHNYLTDAFGAKLTETGRFAYIRGCLRSKNPVTWAMCQGDIEHLDLKKMGSELRDNKAYNGADKTRIRIEAANLPAQLTEHADQVKKLIASDPGYGKIFQIATAVHKEWEGRYRTDAALVELAATMDDARATNSRKAFNGCEDKAWPLWKTAMSSVPAKKFFGMHDDREKAHSFMDDAMGPILSNPEVYLASVALNTCMTEGQPRNAPHDVLIRALGDSLSRWPGFRGPRTATETAIMAAGVELDDRDAKLDFPGVNRPFSGGSGSRSGGGEGVVAALKPSGKIVTVEFKKQLVKRVQCAKVVYTHHITQIRSNGDVVYEANCTKNETVTVDISSQPQKVNPRYLQGVKPGAYVSIIEDVVTGSWAKPGAATPSTVFGAPVK